ncbi:predicted protein [Naegleria gruberi]|uniref:Predicted protein n=1 Tax=Naegleria gruberi TaxID=5762 RepID=D2W145_NAEGR|nr:uncharacterized protein NAEGRDRAFT_75084 [Naegleria gruberi]EFC37299.1 predicted protein [Naegleria gruberi]|eukprot:XP_002670043.1 predicted protein [Naegleria gruberi strain NEG-M]
MLKYYPNYYSQLSDEFKNEKEFKAIAMENLKCNLKYFNVENNDDEFVMALSGNFKRNIKILKSKYGKENIKERIKRIFQQENGRIRKEWLNWPRVYDLYQFHLCYLYTDMEHVFTIQDQIEMIDHGTPAIVKKIAITNDERILERIRMKNLLDIWFSTNSTSFMVVTFRYCLSYKSHQAVYRALDRTFITLQKSDQFLSKVLQVVPKFVKVFFTVRKSYYYDTRTVIDFPFELIRELALENQELYIIYLEIFKRD